MTLVIMARSREWAIFHIAKLVLHLTCVRFHHQLEEVFSQAMSTSRVSRSCAHFCQSVGHFLRIQMDSTEGSLTAARSSLWQLFFCHEGTALPLIAVGPPVFPLRLLLMHGWFVSLRLDSKSHHCCMVNISLIVQYDLCYWGSPQHLSAGTLLGPT